MKTIIWIVGVVGLVCLWANHDGSTDYGVVIIVVAGLFGMLLKLFDN